MKLPCSRLWWEDKSYQRHLDKLKTIQSCVDNWQTARRAKSKNLCFAEAIIEKNNDLLYRRLAKISTDASINVYKSKSCDYTPPKSSAKPAAPPIFRKKKSYKDRVKRLQEEKIERENKLILERLKNKKPMIDTKSLLNDRQETLRILASISRYPKKYLQESTKLKRHA